MQAQLGAGSLNALQGPGDVSEVTFLQIGFISLRCQASSKKHLFKKHLFLLIQV